MRRKYFHGRHRHVLALITAFNLFPGLTLADQVFQIAAPEGLSPTEYAIEVGTSDVTSFTTLKNGVLEISLGGSFAPGSYIVTIYRKIGARYDVAELHDITLDDTGENPVTITADATHEAGLRNVNGQEESWASSSGQLDFGNEDETLTGYIGYLGSSRVFDRVNGRSVNLTEYALSFHKALGNSHATGTIGHQSLGWDPLLVGSESRRGASLSFTNDTAGYEISAFGLRTEDAQGFENITGLSDNQDRMGGLRFAFTTPDKNLTISAQIYDGKGTAFGGIDTGAGRGFSLGLEGHSSNKRLRYGIFGAQSDWDEDESGALFEEKRGRAIHAYADYDIWTEDTGAGTLTAGILYEAIDTNYFSLANQGAVPGEKSLQITADYYNERLSLNFSAATYETNYRGSERLATDRINSLSLSGSWQLAPGELFTGKSLNFGVSTDWQKRLSTPPAIFAPHQDFNSVSANIGLSLNNDISTADISYSFTQLDDKSALNEDETIHLLSLGYSREVSDVFSLSGNFNYSKNQSPFGDFDSNGTQIIAEWAPRDSEWDLRLDMGLTRTNDPADDDGHYVEISAIRPIGKTSELEFFGIWRKGSEAYESGNFHDTVIGVTLRAFTGALQ
ncbi:MAG: hypothetical protein ACPGUX_09860 [Halocynthiibacter sp.]